MAKKQRKQKISGKNEISLIKLGKQIESINSEVNKHKSPLNHNPNPNLMECETGLSKCDRCSVGDGSSPICLWLKENSCSNKCKGFKSSLLSLRLADSRKLNRFVSNGEKTLQIKIRKYLPYAIKIDNEFVDMENKLAIKRRRVEMDKVLNELNELNDADIKEVEPKLRNIRSLI